MNDTPYGDLTSTSYADQHIGISAQDRKKMCTYLGVKDTQDLVKRIVAHEIYTEIPSKLPEPLSERQALAKLDSYIKDHHTYCQMIGMGYYPAITPSAIKRYLLNNPGWYTPYTPYQSEISQGRLEMLFHFQTLCSELTKLELASASLLDEATAACEAMAMSVHTYKNHKHQPLDYFVDTHIHPQTLAVLRSRACGLGVNLWVAEIEEFLRQKERPVCGGITQYPNTYGLCQDLNTFTASVHSRKGLAACITDLLALTLMIPPAEMGFDIALGSSQRFGIPMGYGGPHAAFFVTRMSLKRRMPGRVVGRSKDKHNKDAYRLALQTREQHIRRERATSNICTAQALLASMATAYAAFHGRSGLIDIAQTIHKKATVCADLLKEAGYNLPYTCFFDTLYIDFSGHDHDINQRTSILAKLEEKHINIRTDIPSALLMSFSETITCENMHHLLEAFGITCSANKLAMLLDQHVSLTDTTLRRDSHTFLNQQLFARPFSEIELMRYLKYLENKDLSLTHSMIPLGSCTMKLTSSAALEPLSWPAFSDAHPHQNKEQIPGYMAMLTDLENMLANLTGMAALSLQPNSGAQGELAGLMVIKQYFASKGEAHTRQICLIPSSAHGTNPASAVMAGLKVVVVKCDHHGNIDHDSVTEKLTQYGHQVACLMVTYPSTHGVFEPHITRLCQMLHDVGAQVYLDGANLNAQLEVCRPGEYGIDVCHLNLHKTFCIPHGGGGPGAGPIAVASHLAPYLPKNPYTIGIQNPQQTTDFAVSAAAYGSPLILTIPWMYITMMGAQGLRKATETAILSANYIAQKLQNAYCVLYKGKQGYVAHECLFDLRDITKTTTINVEDIAKRLMDYGFHAPTISFPIPGTMMVEPTESESAEEIDRFITAMLHIRKEIAKVEKGEWPTDNNPLKNAPHPWSLLSEDEWPYPYSRKTATMPLPYLATNKFWPSTSRIDNAHGDRSLICACEPMEAYEETSS